MAQYQPPRSQSAVIISPARCHWFVTVCQCDNGRALFVLPRHVGNVQVRLDDPVESGRRHIPATPSDIPAAQCALEPIKKFEGHPFDRSTDQAGPLGSGKRPTRRQPSGPYAATNHLSGQSECKETTRRLVSRSFPDKHAETGESRTEIHLAIFGTYLVFFVPGTGGF